MTTKKADIPKAATPLERGRFARILADGFEIKVTPSKRSSGATREPKPPAPKG